MEFLSSYSPLAATPNTTNRLRGIGKERVVRFLIGIALFFVGHIGFAEVLNIGITGSNPPFCLTDDKNNFSGLDIDIMNEVAKRMKVEIKYVRMVFENFFPAIQNGNVDLAIDSIIITPERQKQYLFSMPYLVSNVQFLTNKASPVNSPSDLRNKRIGVRQSEQFKKIFTNLFDNNVKITVYNQMEDVFDALATNKVDAIIINRESAQYWFSNNGNQYKLIGDPIPLGMGFGIIAKPDQQELIAKVNEALKSMESDGTYLRIYSDYFN